MIIKGKGETGRGRGRGWGRVRVRVRVRWDDGARPWRHSEGVQEPVSSKGQLMRSRGNGRRLGSQKGARRRGTGRVLGAAKRRDALITGHSCGSTNAAAGKH